MSAHRADGAALRVGIVLAMCAVFAVGLLTPLGVADWVLYLIPVALTLFGNQPAAPILVATGGTAAMLVGFFHASQGLEYVTPTVAALNRAMGGISLWAIAGVARQVIVSRRKLAEQAWVRSGQRDLALRTQGDQEHGALAENILQFLCEYLEAPVGALYLVDDDGLRRVASYALAGDDLARAKLARGEGLLGQAVRSQKLLRFADLAEGHLPVASALGRSRSREVVALPALLDGAAFAAIELGFLRDVVEADLDLLSAVAEPIAVALRSSLDRSHLEELLRRTQEQAEELQAQQEELRVTNEELEAHGRSLREAQARLEAQHAELEQTNAQLAEQAQSIEQQRDELIKSQADLVARSDELARASRYKSEFLATMSHELRTPLNSALILAKLLEDNKEGNLTAEQVKFAATIHAAGDDLLTLINDILDLSRIEAGRLDMNVEPVPLARALDPIERTFRPVAAQKGLTFEVLRDVGTPETVTTDPLRLQQILRNLLSNALKFTSVGGVAVRVSRAPGERIAFEVTDTGEGIPKDKQEIVFEAFRQADGTTQRRHGGTGLGLTISRELAHRLGGEIVLTSEPGRGSTFTLLLPVVAIVQPEPPSPGASPLPPPPEPPALRRAPLPAPALSTPAVPDDRDAIATGDRTVLVVEDDATFAALLRDLVREQRLLCLVAASAADGIALAERFVPAAVLLDIALPDRSGFSVLESLKTNPITRHIPIHVISASDYTRQALELGAVGYIVKPARREQLVEALRRLEERLDRKVRRVLVVEDAPLQRESLVALLGADDVRIVPVGSSTEALAELNRGTFDCMVLDLNLAGESGFDLLDKMALGESFAFPPVIVYTGRALERDEELRLRRYTSSIIIKGARSPERLLDEVTLFLHQVEARLPADAQRILRLARGRDAVLEGRTILIAEDDVRNVFALTSVLEPKGATVRIARNGREAVDEVERARSDGTGAVDLVLMDVMMPEMDGLAATREIRRRFDHAGLPIIALTAKSMPDDREKCLRAGANDYIPKPLDVDKLLSLIKVWMPK